MDLKSPHNIMLMQVSEDEYERALARGEPVRVASFGFLAHEVEPPVDDMGRPVYQLWVHEMGKHWRAEYRMSVEEFMNLRVWQFNVTPRGRPAANSSVRRKRAS